MNKVGWSVLIQEPSPLLGTRAVTVKGGAWFVAVSEQL